MKYRLGFVTNSSSSSYVVAFKMVSDEELETLPDFVKRLYTAFVDNLMSSIKSEEELITYFTSRYCYDGHTLEQELADSHYTKRKYEDWLDKIRNGYGVGSLSVEYGDESIPGFLSNLADGETFIMLEEGE